ncbi:hypothetical protein [Ferruginibacter sp. SUN106]|uniref:hypothetical protein n=1 Tax=Ferruginibacter sp. SUN106 TaxID=2978348 RepID=UPI003D362979
MKILLGFIFFSSLYSCGQNLLSGKETVNIYIAGCDSIFYCEGETFNPKAVQAGKNNDSVFINKLLYNITKENKKVLFKPFGGNCGDGNLGERVLNVKSLLIKNNIEFTISNTDSVENKYFNDVSVIDLLSDLRPPPPPPSPVVVSPASVSTKVIENPFFQFRLEATGKVYYSYDSTDINRNLLPIDPPTKEKLIAVLSNFEKVHQIKFSEETIPVIITGSAAAKYPDFKIIKEALKAKDVFRFKIATDGPAPIKKTETETPIVISARTLTLLVSSTDALFYYHGTDCSSIKKTSTQLLPALLNIEKRNTPAKDLMIVIKQEEGASFKATIDILDKMVLAKIPAKHYAEMDITESEINCIKNFTTK